jgi:hypothetical protein
MEWKIKWKPTVVIRMDEYPVRFWIGEKRLEILEIGTDGTVRVSPILKCLLMMHTYILKSRLRLKSGVLKTCKNAFLLFG